MKHQDITPPPRFTHRPWTPPLTDKKPYAGALHVIALFRQIQARIGAEQDAQTEFQLVEGEYDQIESTLQQDDVLSGCVDDKIRMDLLYRLHWNLLVDFDKVKIDWGPKNEEKIIILFDHSSADVEFGVPSLSRIEVKSRECDEKFQLSYDSEPEDG